MNFFDELVNYDKEVYDACSLELNRQRENIELIASENVVSKAVLLAAGTVLTNKYAEGFPGRRYYGGCQYVDIVEDIARERAKKLFGAEHANVQPHCGASANLAVFFALLNPGDTVMGLNLAHGGHLSHGSPVNISGKYFNVVPYSVADDTEMLDYAEILLGEEIRGIALTVLRSVHILAVGDQESALRFKDEPCRLLAGKTEPDLKDTVVEIAVARVVGADLAERPLAALGDDTA